VCYKTLVRNALRFVVVFVSGLALLTWAAYQVLIETSHEWINADLDLRSRLAVRSAHESLLRHWKSSDVVALRDSLSAITRDERIMGAAACRYDELLTSTEQFPKEYPCALLIKFRLKSAETRDAVSCWTTQLPGGSVRMSLMPVRNELHEVGYVALVQDLSFAERRTRTMRNQILMGFFILAFGGAAVTLVAAKLAWRELLTTIKSGLAGGKFSREYQPLVRDVRELVAQLSRERELLEKGGKWSPARLKAVLLERLQGERVVVVANREPYIHERDESGAVKVVHPASGLVSALEPIMRACSGTWIAHGGGSADRETADAKGRLQVPPDEPSFGLRRIWLSADEEAGYYYGFSNEGLWPLCHVAHARPVFRAEDWEHYRAVNEKFAAAVCEEVDSDDPVILVQDYHFALVPRMVRARLPRATIITFWHIPWPNSERFGICPYRQELIRGLLGSSILGFHTRQHCNNFLDSVDSYVESRIDREHHAVEMQTERTLIRPYPISIEWPVVWAKSTGSPDECRLRVFDELSLASDMRLGVGVDRLDYTKGIEERLAAVDTLLQKYPEFRGRFVFAQLAAPSRTRIERYQELNDRIESVTKAINSKWGSDGYQPIVLLRAHHDRARVFQFLRAADVCYVSSLHDGMNMVAKEFVAAREDEQGVLVLSQFTGAARELTEALIVNPYDIQSAADALAVALRMPQAEQRERLRDMRNLLSELNVYRWAGRMLVDAAKLRHRTWLSGRLTQLADVSGVDLP
jgi:trehalose 6-phosphate synthase